MVAHLVTVLLAATVIGLSLWNFSFFALHPICLIIAYGFLMPQGILLFSKQSSLIANQSRQTKVSYHTYIFLSMWVLMMLGQTVVYTVKENLGKEHFATWHGLFGVLTIVYASAQVLAGLFVRYGVSIKLPKPLTLADLKFLHGVSGCTLMLLSCATLALGFSSSWFIQICHEYVRGACLVAVAILGSVVFSHLYTVMQARQALKAKRS